MGVPSPAHAATEPAPPGHTLSDSDNEGSYTSSEPPKSKAMVTALTVLTCGLYWVYQKFMAKNG